MQGFNHIAGGLVFTGLFASFTDVNIFHEPLYLGTTVLFSVIPDIDHTRSLIGKSFYPLAKWLNSNFGHRTITHSLIFIIATVIIIRLFELLFSRDGSLSIIAFYALLSHCIFDMCTRQGVQFFYPFSKRPAVLPANPKMRLETRDMRSEAVIFIVFCCLLGFCQPLFSNGFWLQYHKALLTYKSVKNESKRNDYLLDLTVFERDTVKGLLLETDENKFVIWDGNKVRQFEADKVKFIDLNRSKMKATRKELKVFDIDLDSLNRILSKLIITAEFQASSNLKYYQGTLVTETKDIKLNWVKGLKMAEVKQDDRDKLNQIELLKIEREKAFNEWQANEVLIRDKEEEKREKAREFERDLRELDKIIESGTLYEKGKAIEKRKAILEEMKVLSREKLKRGKPFYSKDFDLKIRNLTGELVSKRVTISGYCLYLDVKGF